jgi:uracil-DNA glycosylase family protein
MTRKHTDDIEALREAAADCRACPLYKDATQTVFGEGPPTARIMLVGEQPGDKEDLAGKPFVGPAGQMLDRALEEAGIERRTVYVTNAVKHFKFVPRGKIRLHQKPNTPEIKACRLWYERELAAIKPELVVAMRVRENHTGQQEPRPPDRSRRRRNPGAGDGASVLSVAIARCRCQGTGISALRSRPQDRRRPAAKISTCGLNPANPGAAISVEI